jgi:phage protein D
MPTTDEQTKHVTNFIVTHKGKPISHELHSQINSLTVENSLTLHDVATIEFLDAKIDLIDNENFKVGDPIEVSVAFGKNGKETTIFKGEVIESEPEYKLPLISLKVRAFDESHRLTRGRHVRDFQNVTDSDMAKKIAGEAGLDPKGVESTSITHPYIFQDNQSNLEFLKQRAALIGFMTYVRDGVLYFHKLKESKEVQSLGWGKEGLTEFYSKVSSVKQPTEIEVRGWDPKRKQAVVAKIGAGKGHPEAKAADRSGAAQKGATKIGSAKQLLSTTVRSDSQAKQMAQGEADRWAGAHMQAEGVSSGNPTLSAGTSVTFSNLGDKFKGKYIITSATHTFDSKKRYTTNFDVAAHTETTLAGLFGAPESEARVGFSIGIVTNNDDPEGWGRVKVKYPALSEDKESDWARVVSVGAGPERGIEFIPEINDEVLVGFEQGDIHCPYVLGGLWNGKDAPPKKTPDVVAGGKVERRIIRSRTGHIVILDDSTSSPSVTIKTKAGHKIVLDDKAPSITIEDKSGCFIKFDSNSKTIEINATFVKIKGSAMVDIN